MFRNRNRRNRIILTQQKPDRNRIHALGPGSGSGSWYKNCFIFTADTVCGNKKDG